MVGHEKVNLTGNDKFSLWTTRNLSFDAHFHHAIEFCCMLEGEADIYIGGKEYRVKAGEAIITMPNQIHSIFTPEKSHIQVMRIWPELAGSFYADHRHRLPVNAKFKLSHPELIGDGLNGVSNVYEVKALIYSMLSDLINQCNGWQTRDISISVVNELLEIAENEFDSDISLKAIARRVNYNYAYLSVKFCQVMGMSFNDYLNNCRINHACWLLKNSELSIAEVALSTGYNTIRSFNRNFQKYMNTTPVAYRNSSMV